MSPEKISRVSLTEIPQSLLRFHAQGPRLLTDYYFVTFEY